MNWKKVSITSMCVFFVFTILLMSVLNVTSCGTRGSENRTSEQGKTDESSQYRTTARIVALSDIVEDTLDTTAPQNVNGAIYQLLKTKFLEDISSLGKDRFVSGAPTGESGSVSDLVFNEAENTLSWTYKNIGDYDLSGDVGIPDITPIAQYYLAVPTDGIGDDAYEKIIDGDGSNDIGIPDITPVATNFLNEVSSYGIYTSDSPSAGFSLLGSPIQFQTGIGIPPKFTVVIPAGVKKYVKILARDKDGYTGGGSLPLNIESENTPPVVESLSVDTSNIVTVTWTDADDDDVNIVSWIVSTGEGTITALTEDETQATAQFDPPVSGEGTSTITVTISDGINDDVSDSIDIMYSSSEPPVISGVTPGGGKTGNNATFAANTTGTMPFTFSWNFGGGATPNTSTEEMPTVTLGAVGDYNGFIEMENPFGSDTFDFILHVVAENYCPCDDLAEDTVTLYTPKDEVKLGDSFYVFVCANVVPSKPMANLNACRLLVDKSKLLATDIGCLTLSDVNYDFDNEFAENMRTFEPDLFGQAVAHDFWAGFADPSGVQLLAAPALPQDMFVDAGINWGSSDKESSGKCIIAVVEFSAAALGEATVGIQLVDEEERLRTFYSDLNATNHEFGFKGAPITINVVEDLNEAPEIRVVTPQYGISSEESTIKAITRGGNVTSWDWDFGGATSPNTSTDASPSVTFGASGTYNASLTVSNEYGSDTYDFTMQIDAEQIDPFIGIPDDTVFLYSPVTDIDAGDYFYVFVCARIAVAKPIANLNAARILVDKTRLRAKDIGCLELSDINMDYSNVFAETMRFTDTKLFNKMERFDIWNGFGDQSGIVCLVAPALPQPTFVDAGVNWGNNLLMRTGNGILAVVKFKAVSSGSTDLDNQLIDEEEKQRTFYSDLSHNQYLFSQAGETLTVNVS